MEIHFQSAMLSFDKQDTQLHPLNFSAAFLRTSLLHLLAMLHILQLSLLLEKLIQGLYINQEILIRHMGLLYCYTVLCASTVLYNF